MLNGFYAEDKYPLVLHLRGVFLSKEQGPVGFIFTHFLHSFKNRSLSGSCSAVIGLIGGLCDSGCGVAAACHVRKQIKKRSVGDPLRNLGAKLKIFRGRRLFLECPCKGLILT